MNRLARCCVLLFFSVFMVGGEWAYAAEFRDLRDWTQLSGSLRVGYWSSSRKLDGRSHLPVAALWLKAEPKLWENILLTVEGWVRNQGLFQADETTGELREAYVDVHLGEVDLRLGKQLLIWGRADRLNPTDNLTPRDFTLLVPEDDDQRLGVPAVKATYYWRSFSFTGIWLADFTPDHIPLRQPPASIRLRQRQPGSGIAQGALKIEQTGKAIDWSLSYFDGVDLLPDVAIGQQRSPQVDIFLTHNRIRVLGADAATAVGRYGLRAEAAYTLTKDGDGRNPLVKNPFFYLVVGAERSFLEDFNVNIQYLLRVISNFRDPEEVVDPLRRAAALQLAVVTNQRDRVQQGVSLRASYKWLNETLEGEIVSVLSFPRLDCLVRPKLTYALTDHWKGTIGADVFRGSSYSFFGRLRGISAAYVELRWSF